MRIQEGVIPQSRVRKANGGNVSGAGDYVLYWMIANRRRRYNFSLQHAVNWAAELRKPLLIVEGLNSDYPWASDRIHAFVLDGMKSNFRAFRGCCATYVPLVQGHCDKEIHSFAAKACVVVVDDYPAFVIPQWTQVMAERTHVLVECVDGAGLFPFRATTRTFETAHSFRRLLQQRLRSDLEEMPLPDSLDGVELPRLPGRLKLPLPPATFIAAAPIDHSVPRVRGVEGGESAAGKRLSQFLDSGLPNYADKRNELESANSSALSPYLHFGHLGVHEVFSQLARQERWHAARLGKTNGSRVGWWGMRPDAEAFLDQIVTWREIGFNRCATDPAFDQYCSLPGWARRTLLKHAADPRKHIYSVDQLETASTHDTLWNAAQRELLSSGTIHNYLRMLWGKKILEWSATPEEALAVMLHLNNKYALDGRDPNSYSGIFWTIGRYDRPWGPERPIFGTVRYMSSENTARKLNVRTYLRRFASV
jgi:deoxyribodipyrimidine photo-lyase